jgi:uncharacterized protein (UPF0216 family)
VSDFLEKELEREIDRLNNHLPKNLVSLEELLLAPTARYETQSGEFSTIRREELEFLSREVPERFHGDFRLPIVILRRLDMGPGIHTVAGGKPELFLVQKVLGYVDLGWECLTAWQPVDRLARPQVQLVRRVLPSASCLGFATAPNQQC